jgi:hypothetical protein
VAFLFHLSRIFQAKGRTALIDALTTACDRAARFAIELETHDVRRGMSRRSSVQQLRVVGLGAATGDGPGPNCFDVNSLPA